jgi:hypothetical protein
MSFLKNLGKGAAAPAKTATKKVAKAAPVTVKKAGTVSTGTRKGGVGYRCAWVGNCSLINS